MYLNLTSLLVYSRSRVATVSICGVIEAKMQLIVVPKKGRSSITELLYFDPENGLCKCSIGTVQVQQAEAVPWGLVLSRIVLIVSTSSTFSRVGMDFLLCLYNMPVQ